MNTQKVIHVKKSIMIILTFFTSNCLYADPTQSLDLLKNKIEQHVRNELPSYIRGKVEVSTDKIDRQLNLKACAESQLAVFNPYQTPMLNTHTMGIKCKEDNNHWTLYVSIKIKNLSTQVIEAPVINKNQAKIIIVENLKG